MSLVGFHRIEHVVNKPKSSQFRLHTFEQAENCGEHDFLATQKYQIIEK